MPFVTLGKVGRGAAAASVACLVGLCLSPPPAVAGDDGAAPLWVSLGSTLGLFRNDDQPDINYIDRPRLVVPPKLDLPPPGSAPWAGVADWPRDPDVANWKKEQAEKKAIHPMLMDPARRTDNKFPDQATTVTTNYTAGMGPSTRGKCAAGPGESCDSPPSPSINWNPLTWVGIQKKPATVLGPEPSRASLTDPPVGYRAPAEGAGVKIDNN
jgi:hypothetical protein